MSAQVKSCHVMSHLSTFSASSFPHFLFLLLFRPYLFLPSASSLFPSPSLSTLPLPLSHHSWAAHTPVYIIRLRLKLARLELVGRREETRKEGRKEGQKQQQHYTGRLNANKDIQEFQIATRRVRDCNQLLEFKEQRDFIGFLYAVITNLIIQVLPMATTNL